MKGWRFRSRKLRPIGGARHGIFVARLINKDHFELLNGGNPISNTGNDATVPDITFSRNTPYVSWTSGSATDKRGFVGHFDAYGQFVSDTPGGIRLTNAAPRRTHG